MGDVTVHRKSVFFHGTVEEAREVAKGRKSISKCSENGASPLHCACVGGNAAVVEMLLSEFKAQQICEDDQRRTPLHCAAASGSLETCTIIVVDLEARRWTSKLLMMVDELGNTPLHLAMKDPAVFEYLLGFATEENQLQRNEFQSNKQRPGLLHAAARTGDVSSVQLLLAKGMDVGGVDAQSLTALTAAASEGHLEAVQLLVGAGADASAVDGNGSTAAHWAFCMEHRGVGDWLMANGCSAELADSDGKTAQDWRLTMVGGDGGDEDEGGAEGVACARAPGGAGGDAAAAPTSAGGATAADACAAAAGTDEAAAGSGAAASIFDIAGVKVEE
jgi:ankyrin repeat protein